MYVCIVLKESVVWEHGLWQCFIVKMFVVFWPSSYLFSEFGEIIIFCQHVKLTAFLVADVCSELWSRPSRPGLWFSGPDLWCYDSTCCTWDIRGKNNTINTISNVFLIIIMVWFILKLVGSDKNRYHNRFASHLLWLFKGRFIQIITFKYFPVNRSEATAFTLD